MKINQLFLVFAVLTLIGLLTGIGIVSSIYHNESMINNQYQKSLSNVTHYNITQDTGSVQCQILENDQRCWITVITGMNSYSQNQGYLQYYYPLYRAIDVYYKEEECVLTLPYETGPYIGLIICLIGLALIDITSMGFGIYHKIWNQDI